MRSMKELLSSLIGEKLDVVLSGDTGTIYINAHPNSPNFYDEITDVGEDIFEVHRYKLGQVQKVYLSINHVLKFEA